MRTNIVLDDDLMNEAFKLTGYKTKKELVHEALKLLIKTRKRMSIRELRGKVHFHDDYDYKKLRT
jgi:Arc/MetJ family transcription regulator